MTIRKFSRENLPGVEGVGRSRSQRRFCSCWDTKHNLGKLKKDRDRARMLQGKELPVAEGDFTVATSGSSFRSCSLSLALDVDEGLSTPSRRSPSLGKDRDGWSTELEDEMEHLAVQGIFSLAASGSTNLKEKAGHWSTQTVLAQELDDVIPGMQPSRNETDGGFIMCEVEEQQAARVEVQGSKKKSDTCRIRRNARLCP